MKILITGGAGFIRWNNKTNSTGQVGSNLVDHFLAEGHEVVCLDDLSTGFKKNIEHNFENPNFKFIEGDIRDIQTCIHSTMQCDYVCHRQLWVPSLAQLPNDP